LARDSLGTRNGRAIAPQLYNEAALTGIDMPLPGMGLVQDMFQIRRTRSGLSSKPRYVSLITPALICLSQIGLVTAQEPKDNGGGSIRRNVGEHDDVAPCFAVEIRH
jgi:hypothetical protein